MEGGPVKSVNGQVREHPGQQITGQDRSLTEAAEANRRAKEAHEIYGRGKKVRTKNIRDKKLRGNLRALEEKYRDATGKARDAEILLDQEVGFLEAEGELERTFKTKQSDVRQEIAVETAKKGFELKLGDLGPYKAKYSRNGRDLLLAGHKGHLATMQWRDGKLGCELQLGETIRDATWLHNNQYFAVAQKKHTYIYDSHGVELHKLQNHIECTHLQFLPYHFLLAAVGITGKLEYLDTSTGAHVAEIPTKMGAATGLGLNPSNGIVHVGHQNGTVTLWSPTSQLPLVKMLAHRGPVRDVAIDREGRYMVSTGNDQMMSVWDIRQFKKVHDYHLPRPGACVSVSDRNLVAVGWGTSVEIWREVFDKASTKQVKAQKPYMRWGGEGQRIESLAWCPFEDILGVGHDKGFSSAIIPGAGEANFDALEVNPYETTKQRQEAEVRALLNKLQPGMISLNPDFIGNLDLSTQADRARERREEEGGDQKNVREVKEKNKQRGRNTSLKRAIRKRGLNNIIDERRLQIDEALARNNVKEQERLQREEEALGPALSRFVRRGG